MADKGKKNMEDLSTEELHEQIENDKKHRFCNDSIDRHHCFVYCVVCSK